MSETLLEVRGLKKSYLSPEGSRQAILDLPHFALAERQQLALRGSSGSGKTTFLHLVAGILAPDAGTIVLAGQALDRLTEPQRDAHRARTLGYVFQTFNLLQGFSALENVLLAMSFGAGANRAEAERLLHRVGLGNRMHHKPSQLSTGQQQRVAVARALANRPRLLLADEPTGNLDARHAIEVLDLLREVAQEAGTALLLVSHDEKALSRFDNVVDFAELNQVARS